MHRVEAGGKYKSNGGWEDVDLYGSDIRSIFTTQVLYKSITLC